MMRRLATLVGILGLAAAVFLWVLSGPNPLPDEELAAMGDGDAARGETVFWAGGCGSCHAAKGAKGDDKLTLGGRHPLVTPFGTFYAPNISPHTEHGIGAWTRDQFANAMARGLAPDGSHYYPAFPYTSYACMELADIADLWAFLGTLEPVDTVNLDHDLPLIFSIRRGLGLWKWLFLSDQPVVAIDEADAQLVRGRYLVEGPAHCGECHTPRNLIGGVDQSRWLAGGPAPEGEGFIPNITPHETGIGSWTADDIAFSLESGFTPEFDSFGASMVSVQDNMARLPAGDREAIAAYLKHVRPVATRKPVEPGQ